MVGDLSGGKWGDFAEAASRVGQGHFMPHRDLGGVKGWSAACQVVSASPIALALRRLLQQLAADMV